MHQEYPKLMYGRGAATRLVHDARAEDEAAEAGFSTRPGEAHRPVHRGETAPAPAAPLTEAHIPLIIEGVARALGAQPRGDDGAEALTADHVPGLVDAVFERLRGMAQAAAAEPAAREAAEGVEALRSELDERFAALKGELLAELRPAAPATAAKKG